MCAAIRSQPIRCPDGFKIRDGADSSLNQQVYVRYKRRKRRKRAIQGTCVTSQYALCECKTMLGRCPRPAGSVTTATFRGIWSQVNAQGGNITEPAGMFSKFETVKTVALTAPFKATADPEPPDEFAMDDVQKKVNRVFVRQFLAARNKFVKKCANSIRRDRIEIKNGHGHDTALLKPCELPYIYSEKGKWKRWTIKGSEHWEDTPTRCSNENPLVNSWFGHDGQGLAWLSFDPQKVERAGLKPTGGKGSKYKEDGERQYSLEQSNKGAFERMQNAKSRMMIMSKGFGDKEYIKHGKQLVRLVKKMLPRGAIVVRGKTEYLLYVESGDCATLYTLYITMVKDIPLSRTTKGSGTITEPLLSASLKQWTVADLESGALRWMPNSYWGDPRFWKTLSAPRKEDVGQGMGSAAFGKPPHPPARPKHLRWSSKFDSDKTRGGISNPRTCDKIDGAVRKAIAKFRLKLSRHREILQRQKGRQARKRRRRRDLRIEAGLKNAGKNCWQACGHKQGNCNWCGTDGMCCRYGWHDKSRGCSGKIGIQGTTGHVCAAGQEQSSYEANLGEELWATNGRGGSAACSAHSLTAATAWQQCSYGHIYTQEPVGMVSPEWHGGAWVYTRLVGGATLNRPWY